MSYGRGVKISSLQLNSSLVTAVKMAVGSASTIILNPYFSCHSSQPDPDSHHQSPKPLQSVSIPSSTSFPQYLTKKTIKSPSENRIVNKFKQQWNATNAYYKKMIESDPVNSLVLGNYAKFLKEIGGDIVRAEEYCERAILVNPNDGKVVCLYAELIWEVHGDATRAQMYFDQAVKLEPNDTSVLASYARFLWDTEDE